MTHSSSSRDISLPIDKVRLDLGLGRLGSWKLIEIRGTDAVSFLHQRTTSDVNSLRPGEGHWSCLLDRKASIKAFFSLHLLHSESVWLLIEEVSRPLAIEEIERYHITESFQIVDHSQDYALYALQGFNAPDFLQEFFTSVSLPPESFSIENGVINDLGIQALPIEEGKQPIGNPILLIRRSWIGEGELGYCLAIPVQNQEWVQQIESDIQKPSTIIMTDEMFEVCRIENGFPKMGVDMTPETLLPETGLERIAVSWTKGCYLGQETVARVKTYGSVTQALIGLSLKADSLIPPFNTPCFLNGQPVGVIKSSIYSPTLKQVIALAYLNRESRTPGTGVTLEVNGQQIEGSVTSLPFYQNDASLTKALKLLESGLHAFAKGEDIQALRCLQKAILLDPFLADAYESLGIILGRHERIDEAIVLMKRLLEIDPERIMAHTNLSIYYMKQGKIEEAETEKAKALSLSMKQALNTASQQKEAELQQKEKEALLLERIELFNQALDLNPTDSLACYGLGSSLLELKRYTEAIHPLQQAIQHQPNHTAAYLALGKSYAASGEPQSAKETYTRGLVVASRRGDQKLSDELQQRLQLLEPHV